MTSDSLHVSFLSFHLPDQTRKRVDKWDFAQESSQLLFTLTTANKSRMRVDKRGFLTEIADDKNLHKLEWMSPRLLLVDEPTAKIAKQWHDL